MRARPQILLDVLAAAGRAIGLRAANEGRYEEFLTSLQDQGAYDTYVLADEVLEARIQGAACPACGDKGNCAACGWTDEQLPPPGWYPDPENEGYRRYWTGQRWDGAPVEMLWDDDVEVEGVYEPIGWRD